MSAPKLLDLYSCEGGAAEGYRRAGWQVYCLDLFEDYNRKRCPFPTHKGDAIHALVRLLCGESLPFTHLDGTVEWLGLADFLAAHASPPCQDASAGTRSLRKNGKEYPALIEPTRYLLQQTGLPWIIENVKGSALRSPTMLCGSMFGLHATDEDGLPLRLERHRMFESNMPISAPALCHHDPKVRVAGVYGGSRGRKPGQTAAEHRDSCQFDRRGGYVPREKSVKQALLGIEWMTVSGMYQSLPPVYTQHLGLQLMARLGAAA